LKTGKPRTFFGLSSDRLKRIRGYTDLKPRLTSTKKAATITKITNIICNMIFINKECGINWKYLEMEFAVASNF